MKILKDLDLAIRNDNRELALELVRDILQIATKSENEIRELFANILVVHGFVVTGKCIVDKTPTASNGAEPAIIAAFEAILPRILACDSLTRLMVAARKINDTHPGYIIQIHLDGSGHIGPGCSKAETWLHITNMLPALEKLAGQSGYEYLRKDLEIAAREQKCSYTALAEKAKALLNALSSRESAK